VNKVPGAPLRMQMKNDTEVTAELAIFVAVTNSIVSRERARRLRQRIAGEFCPPSEVAKRTDSQVEVR